MARVRALTLLGLATRSCHGSELASALRLRAGSVRSLSDGVDQPVVTVRPQLTLEAADVAASAALAEAKERSFKDISVVVLDSSGRVLVSKTMVNCPKLIPELAYAKAGAVIGTHASSRALKDKYVPDRTPQLLGMTAVSSQPFIAVPGGVLCRDEAKNVVGAIGVSGATADEDEHCAIVGAQAIGLVTEPAESPLQTS